MFKDIFVGLLAILTLTTTLMCAGMVIANKKAANAPELEAHKKEIADFRKAWMADCLQHVPPFQCIAMWSQVKPDEWVP